MQDDQKDQVLLRANESTEVVLRLNAVADCGFLKARQLDKTMHNNCREQTSVIEFGNVLFAKAWHNTLCAVTETKKTDPTRSVFLYC